MGAILESVLGEDEELTQDSSGDIEVESVEVSGILVDRMGRKWAVPAGNVADIADSYAKDPYEELDYDPNFHYQTVPISKAEDAMARGFAPVDKKELGVPTISEDVYGKPVASIHQVGDAILMKIPKKIAQAIQMAKNRKAKAALEALEPTAQQLAEAQRQGFSLKTNRSRSIGGFTATGEKEI
jgi:hypothetical protein